MSEVAIVIPARMESSRFPNKPLAKLFGREMILHVLDRVTEVASKEITYVATDSFEIAQLVEKSGFQVVMTGDHPTGTDRLAEANRIINAPFVLNIQGDEPAFNPADVTASIEFLKNSGFNAITGYCDAEGHSEFEDRNTIKVAFSRGSSLLYISRASIPGSKKDYPANFYRQVCMYGYTQGALASFAEMPRGTFELVEDHELLRFLENDVPVGVVKLSDWSVPVDMPGDIALAENQLRKKFFLTNLID
jgi:3-deoxy-manno-octulosonate cytidylyltransferase (CMP-KDO synthetase)